MSAQDSNKVKPLLAQSQRSTTSSEPDNGENNDLDVPKTSLMAVLAIQTVDFVSGSIAYSMLPFLAQYYGASKADVGYLFSTYNIAAVVFMPLFVRIADWVGRVPALVLSVMLCAIGQFVNFLAPDLGWLFLGQALAGMSNGIQAVSNSYLCDVTLSSEARATWFSYQSSIPGFAVAIGPPLGGFFGGISYSFPFLVGGILCLLVLFVAGYYLLEPPAFLRFQLARSLRASLRIGEGGNEEESKVRFAPKNTSFVAWLLLLNGFFGGFVQTGMALMQTLFLVNQLKFEPLQAGCALSPVAFITVFMGLWLIPYVQPRFGLYNTIVLGALCSAVAQGCILTGSDHSALFFIYLWNASNNLVRASGPSILSTHCDPTNRATVFSYLSIGENIGRVLAPIISGHLSMVDIRLPFLCFGVGNFLCFILVSICKIRDSERMQVWVSEFSLTSDLRFTGATTSRRLSTLSVVPHEHCEP